MAMFELHEIPHFFLAFFLVLPVISLLHEAGHVFFAWIMGGKNIRVSIGTGKKLFDFGMLEVRKYYFWYGLCTFENLRVNKIFSHLLIFLGGSLFNILAAVAVVALLQHKLLEPTILTYQFTYFSLYYIFFALLPMTYPDGTSSDGKIIVDLIKKKRSVIKVKTYRINYDRKKEQWQVLDHKRKLLKECVIVEDAQTIAANKARKNRPSRVVEIKEKEKREMYNFPRIPL